MVELNTTIENVLVKDYDNKPFSGVTSMAYCMINNTIYFTDSGKIEVNQLYPSYGSVFSIDLDSKIIKPILYECLSFPADIVYDYINKCIYVAEMLANRVIRIKTDSSGVYHSTVFYQFSGRIGPRALTIDELGNLYVARYEIQDNTVGTIDNHIVPSDGLISVIDASGIIRGEIILPRMPEIISLFIPSKKKDTLYLTLNENKAIFKIKLSVFTSELEMIDMNNKKNYMTTNLS